MRLSTLRTATMPWLTLEGKLMDLGNKLSRLADLQAQVCAAGALLNILGPELGEKTTDPARAGFGKVLSCTIALSAVYDSMYGEAPQPPLV